MKKFLKIAHRCVSAYAPENTLSAFKKATELGADMIELDVKKTVDNEFIIVHDPTLNRTTSGKGKVITKTLVQLKKLDAGSWFSEQYSGEKIPTFQEVLDFIKNKIGLNIELSTAVSDKMNYSPNILLKSNPFELIINKKNKPPIDTYLDLVDKKIIKPLIQTNQINNTIISSFDYKLILTLTKIYPKIKFAYIFKYLRSYPEDEFCRKLYAICPLWKICDKKLIEKSHKLGLKIFPWTCNKPKEIQKMKDLVVDGIISNYPDRL